MPLAHRIRYRWRSFRGTPIAGVSVVIANSDGDILLLRHSYGPRVWALPGGGLKSGEDPAEAARREIREELDMVLNELEPVARLEEDVFASHHVAHLFYATSDAVPVPDRREVITARFFPMHSLPDDLGRVTQQRIAAFQAYSAG